MEAVRAIYHREGKGWWAEHFVPLGERVAT
jgi:hypothetical protein